MKHSPNPPTTLHSPIPAVRASVLDSLPVWTAPALWHVGQLDEAPRLRSCSYEGPGVSVSLDPDAWRQIARLSGPTWVLTRVDGKMPALVNYHGLSHEQRQALTDAAITAGWLDHAESFEVEEYDDEFARVLVTPFRTLEEALGEFDVLNLAADEEAAVRNADDTWRLDVIYERLSVARAARARGQATVALVGHATDSDRYCLTVRAGVEATPALQAWWAQSFSGQLPRALAEEMAHARVLASVTPFDGIWWNDLDDPATLTAPRGVIFPHRLAQFGWSRLHEKGPQQAVARPRRRS